MVAVGPEDPAQVVASLRRGLEGLQVGGGGGRETSQGGGRVGGGEGGLGVRSPCLRACCGSTLWRSHVVFYS
jgi:hypothetical protein